MKKAGRGRPPSNTELSRMQISMPPGTLDAVTIMAAGEDRSISSMCRVLLVEALTARAEQVAEA